MTACQEVYHFPGIGGNRPQGRLEGEVEKRFRFYFSAEHLGIL
jgi:hypothetical protein